MKVKLSSCGNPDFGQNPNRSVSPNKTVIVKSLMQASKVCRDYIGEHELGGGNWTGGQVFDASKEVAYISYNGRIWEK